MRPPRIAAAAVLLLLIVCVFWKLTLLNQQYTWLDARPIAGHVLPWFQMEAAAFHAHQFPLWNPFLGQAALTNEDSGAAYPLNWLLFLAPLHRGWVQSAWLNIYFIAIHFLAGWGAYLLVRQLGHSREAGVFAGLVFGASGFCGTETHPAQLNAATWAPWILWQAAKLDQSVWPWRESALAGAFLGFAFLSGAMPLAGVLALVTAALWLLWAWPAFAQRWRAVAICASMALLVGGFTLAPALAEAWSQPVPLYAAISERSFDMDGLFGILIPGVRNDLTPFVGLVVLTLASVAIRTQWQVREVRLLAALAAFGFAFALGHLNTFHGILYGVLPWLAREPVHAIAVMHVALAALAGVGLDAARREIPRDTVKSLLILAAFCGVLIVGLLMFVSDQPKRFNGLGELALIALLLAAVLALWQRGTVTQTAGIALLFFVAMTEMANQTTFFWPPREKGWPYLEKLAQYNDIVDFFRTQAGNARIAYDPADVPVDFASWNGVEAVPMASAALLGANFTLGTKPAFPDQKQVFEGHEGLHVYDVPGAFARAWVVHRVAAPPLTDAALVNETFVEGGSPQVESCTGPENITQLSSTDYTAHLNCRGLVMIGNQWQPWWTAQIDGKRTKLWKAGGQVMAVAVPAGEHRITLRYRPVPAYIGAAMTGLGTVMLMLVLFKRSQRSA